MVVCCVVPDADALVAHTRPFFRRDVRSCPPWFPWRCGVPVGGVLWCAVLPFVRCCFLRGAGVPGWPSLPLPYLMYPAASPAAPLDP